MPKPIPYGRQHISKKDIEVVTKALQHDFLTQGPQIDLFEDTRKTADLYHAMDRIRNRFGSRCIMRASTFGAKTIGGKMNPFNGEPPIVLAHRTA